MAFSLTVPLPAGMFSTIWDPKKYIKKAMFMYKSFYCTKTFEYMVYRVSISEDTMERARKYTQAKHKYAYMPGKPGNGKYSYTVDDLICELLTEEGF